MRAARRVRAAAHVFGISVTRRLLEGARECQSTEQRGSQNIWSNEKHADASVGARARSQRKPHRTQDVSLRLSTSVPPVVFCPSLVCLEFSPEAVLVQIVTVGTGL